MRINSITIYAGYADFRDFMQNNFIITMLTKIHSEYTDYADFRDYIKSNFNSDHDAATLILETT